MTRSARRVNFLSGATRVVRIGRMKSRHESESDETNTSTARSTIVM